MKLLFLCILALGQEIPHAILDVSIGQGETCDGGLVSKPATDHTYQCFSYMANMCCTSNDTLEIKENIEQMLVPLYKTCPGCAYNLKQMQCAALCSPYQGLFKEFHTIRICKSACYRLYESCKHSKGPDGEKVSDYYSDPIQFCESNTGILAYLNVKVVEVDCWMGHGPESCEYVEDPVFRGMEDRNSDAGDWDTRISLAASAYNFYKDTGNVKDKVLYGMLENISAFLKAKRNDVCDEIMEDSLNSLVKYAENRERNDEWKSSQASAFIAGMMQKLFLKCWYVTEIKKESKIDKDAFFENLLLEPEIIERELAEGAILNVLDERMKLAERQIGATFTNDHKKQIKSVSEVIPKVPKSGDDIRIMQQNVGNLFKNLYSQLSDIESTVMKAIDGKSIDDALAVERLNIPSIIDELKDKLDQEEEDDNEKESFNLLCMDRVSCILYQIFTCSLLLAVISFFSYRELTRKDRPIALTNIGITCGITLLWMLVVYFLITDSLTYTFLLGLLIVPLSYFLAQVFTIFFLIPDPPSRPPEIRNDERRRGKKGKRPRAEV